MRTVAGFTLIGLLVAIAMIALLMAILMPALSKARDQAPTIAPGRISSITALLCGGTATTSVCTIVPRRSILDSNGVLGACGSVTEHSHTVSRRW